MTILYTAPTAIRSHMKWGPEYAQQHDLSSLRLLGSVGEPINPEAWVWYHEHIGGGRCPIVDTWWQTETGMILITPLPGVTTTKPGSATRPFPGVEAAVYNEAGDEVGPGGGGYLVLQAAVAGDAARHLRRRRALPRDVLVEVRRTSTSPATARAIDEDGDFWLLGRVDDVMNVSGHRISTIEVESALVDHHEVAEAAVAARNDAMTGQAIVAFVTLKGGAEGSVEKLEELRNHVAEKIGPIAKPANIVFTPELPKTRSGKIMRRLLRDVAENRPLGDTTTLADPTVVDEIRTRGTPSSRRGLSRARRSGRGSARTLAAAVALPRIGARAGRERLGGAGRGAPAARPARLADRRRHRRAAARARRAHADAGALRRAGARARGRGRVDEDRGPRPAVAARRARLPGLGALVAARRRRCVGAARRHGDGARRLANGTQVGFGSQVPGRRRCRRPRRGRCSRRRAPTSCGRRSSSSACTTSGAGCRRGATTARG